MKRLPRSKSRSKSPLYKADATAGPPLSGSSKPLISSSNGSSSRPVKRTSLSDSTTTSSSVLDNLAPDTSSVEGLSAEPALSTASRPMEDASSMNEDSQHTDSLTSNSIGTMSTSSTSSPSSSSSSLLKKQPPLASNSLGLSRKYPPIPSYYQDHPQPYLHHHHHRHPLPPPRHLQYPIFHQHYQPPPPQPPFFSRSIDHPSAPLYMSPSNVNSTPSNPSVNAPVMPNYNQSFGVPGTPHRVNATVSTPTPGGHADKTPTVSSLITVNKPFPRSSSAAPLKKHKPSLSPGPGFVLPSIGYASSSDQNRAAAAVLSSQSLDSDIAAEIQSIREEIKDINRSKYDLILSYEQRINELTRRQLVVKLNIKDHIKSTNEYNQKYLNALQNELDGATQNSYARK